MAATPITLADARRSIASTTSNNTPTPASRPVSIANPFPVNVDATPTTDCHERRQINQAVQAVSGLNKIVNTMITKQGASVARDKQIWPWTTLQHTVSQPLPDLPSLDEIWTCVPKDVAINDLDFEQPCRVPNVDFLEEHIFSVRTSKSDLCLLNTDERNPQLPDLVAAFGVTVEELRHCLPTLQAYDRVRPTNPSATFCQAYSCGYQFPFKTRVLSKLRRRNCTLCGKDYCVRCCPMKIIPLKDRGLSAHPVCHECWDTRVRADLGRQIIAWITNCRELPAQVTVTLLYLVRQVATNILPWSSYAQVYGNTPSSVSYLHAAALCHAWDATTDNIDKVLLELLTTGRPQLAWLTAMTALVHAPRLDKTRLADAAFRIITEKSGKEASHTALLLLVAAYTKPMDDRQDVTQRSMHDRLCKFVMTCLTSTARMEWVPDVICSLKPRIDVDKPLIAHLTKVMWVLRGLDAISQTTASMLWLKFAETLENRWNPDRRLQLLPCLIHCLDRAHAPAATWCIFAENLLHKSRPDYTSVSILMRTIDNKTALLRHSLAAGVSWHQRLLVWICVEQLPAPTLLMLPMLLPDRNSKDLCWQLICRLTGATTYIDTEQLGNCADAWADSVMTQFSDVHPVSASDKELFRQRVNHLISIARENISPSAGLIQPTAAQVADPLWIQQIDGFRIRWEPRTIELLVTHGPLLSTSDVCSLRAAAYNAQQSVTFTPLQSDDTHALQCIQFSDDHVPSALTDVMLECAKVLQCMATNREVIRLSPLRCQDWRANCPEFRKMPADIRRKLEPISTYNLPGSLQEPIRITLRPLPAEVIRSNDTLCDTDYFVKPVQLHLDIQRGSTTDEAALRFQATVNDCMPALCEAFTCFRKLQVLHQANLVFHLITTALKCSATAAELNLEAAVQAWLQTRRRNNEENAPPAQVLKLRKNMLTKWDKWRPTETERKITEPWTTPQPWSPAVSDDGAGIGVCVHVTVDMPLAYKDKTAKPVKPTVPTDGVRGSIEFQNLITN